MKDRTILLLITFALSAFLLIYHAISLKLHLYWNTAWIDAPAHALGGFVSALVISLALMFLRKDFSLKQLLFLVLTVGLLWEVFEAVFKVVDIEDPSYGLDTMGDIVMDIAGGVAAYLYLLKSFILRAKKEENVRN